MRRALLGALCALPLSSCAGVITAVTDRPITTDHLESEPIGQKLKTISGDRRLVRVDKVGPSLITLCAETQADAISAHAGKDSLTIEARGGYSDEASEALTATYARTELSDIVRQMSWQNCNAYLNAIYDKETFAAQLQALQKSAFDVLMARALHPAGGEKAPAPDAADTATCKPDEKMVNKKCVKASATSS